MNLFVFLKNKYNYTDYEIKLIHYSMITFISEISKLLILGCFFSFISKLSYYVWAIFIFLFLRRYSGGYHCKTYISCFLLSFIYMYSAVILLPNIPMNRIAYLFIFFISILLINAFSPMPSIYHQKLNRHQIITYRLYINIFLIICMILVLKFPKNHFLIISFWEIIMHTLQLSIEFFKRKRCIKWIFQSF